MKNYSLKMCLLTLCLIASVSEAGWSSGSNSNNNTKSTVTVTKTNTQKVSTPAAAITQSKQKDKAVALYNKEQNPFKDNIKSIPKVEPKPVVSNVPKKETQSITVIQNKTVIVNSTPTYRRYDKSEPYRSTDDSSHVTTAVVGAVAGYALANAVNENKANSQQSVNTVSTVNTVPMTDDQAPKQPAKDIVVKENNGLGFFSFLLIVICIVVVYSILKSRS